ncbi:MAG: cytochrome C oxidase subunit IV family protein [Gemmataceae bacterium]|nr:cytochrome C oxidase subunit IV family protein [Gemmataceae bacterium]
MAEHVVEPRTYYKVFGALIALTVLTVTFSRLPVYEEWHLIVGLAVAATKATLVILFFMHLIYSSRLTWVVAFSGLLWLGILIAYTLTDYLTRGWNPRMGK